MAQSAAGSRNAGARAAAHQAARWRWAFVATASACGLIFATDVALLEVHPGSTLGMAYGIAATVLMIGVALFGARRRAMRLASRRSLGRSRAWLAFHLYGGALFLLLVLMHSGFRLPVGTLNWLLWVSSVWLTLSGLAGLALQRWIPRVLTSGLATEVNYDRIPELTEELRQRAESVAERCDDSVRALYAKTVAPALQEPTRGLIFFLDPTGGIQARLKPFRYLESRLPAAEKAQLAELEKLYRAKLEIDAHYTLQQALRRWLIFHAPLSLLLIALVTVHIFTVSYY